MPRARYLGGTLPRAHFLGGTLVLEGVPQAVRPPAPFHWVDAKWRCPAVHYRAVRPWLKREGIQDSIPRRRAGHGQGT